MGQDSRPAQEEEELAQEDDLPNDVMDGRLSAIMPRCGYYAAAAMLSVPLLLGQCQQCSTCHHAAGLHMCQCSMMQTNRRTATLRMQ
jgi:hypothetical protein